MLVRASTLKVIRLQLALERNDRRVALEAVDDLVALDRSLEEHLASVPAVRDQVMLGHFLEAERAALNFEKLALTAQVIRNDNPDPPPANLPPPQRTEPAEEVGGSPEPLDTADVGPGAIAAETPSLDHDGMDEMIEPDPARRIHWLIVGLAVLFSVMAVAAYWLGVPAALAWLPTLGG